MLRWEYLTMECAGEGEDTAIRITGPAEEPLDLPPTTTRLAAMNSMGHLGWELVGSEVVRTDIRYADLSVAHGESQRIRYLFKRPRGTDDAFLAAEAMESVLLPGTVDPA